VPIINFRFKWNIDDKFGILLDGDALAAPQGRAEDIQLAATYQHTKNIGFRAGYRILEGGAANNSVYNFTIIHYASFGMTYTFSRKISSH
jgi:predicted porin